jgi:hypothetical protein
MHCINAKPKNMKMKKGKKSKGYSGGKKKNASKKKGY